jgi:4-hydroxy-tetrahydrodipicolinate reductase
MLKLCVAGATGRMGIAVIEQAEIRGHQVVGAIESPSSQSVGKSLRELGIANSDTRVLTPARISQACLEADVYISFASPSAEMENIPVVAALGKRIVLGTTGFTEDENRKIRSVVEGKVPVVFSPNYSVGVNIFFKLAKMLKSFPADYSFSISEIHHTGKQDAPSGTAKKLGEIVSDARGYKTTVYGREGICPRRLGELEIVSMRAGGVPGIHDLIIAGQNEMLKIEHIAFSRNVFAQGAVLAAEWLSNQNEPRIFSMENVLELA